jgi:hypothetical protein
LLKTFTHKRLARVKLGERFLLLETHSGNSTMNGHLSTGERSSLCFSPKIYRITIRAVRSGRNKSAGWPSTVHRCQHRHAKWMNDGIDPLVGSVAPSLHRKRTNYLWPAQSSDSFHYFSPISSSVAAISHLIEETFCELLSRYSLPISHFHEKCLGI